MLIQRSFGLSSFFFTLPVALCAIAFAGCSEDYADGPTEPSNTIATVTVSSDSTAESLSALVTCKGDADDIAKLGSLCAGTPLTTSMSDAQAGSRLMTAAASTGPALLVYAFPPSGVSAEASEWSPSGIRYAAFLVLEQPASQEPDSAWSDGDALSGELGARTLRNEACSDAWQGGGVLHWHSVTITLDWSAGIPC